MNIYLIKCINIYIFDVNNRPFYSKGCKAGDQERRRSSNIVKVVKDSKPSKTQIAICYKGILV
jgi:hypothetical protein